MSDDAHNPLDPVIKHHNSPYYFNGGEIFIMVCIGALTISVGWMFSAAVIKTYRSIANDVPSAWIAFVIVLALAVLLIICLSHLKKPLMRLAHKTRILHH